MTGMLTLAESDDYYFDEEAGNRPVRFIERFCKHYEGQFAGQPFILDPIQRQIVRDLYGWKWRRGPQTGFRRFTDCYFEGAVGAGKSPLLAGLGLYSLMADSEPGAQVYSLASTYGQARVIFDMAKKFVAASADLERRLNVVEREIRHRPSQSAWQIVSGKGPGAGCRPHFVAADEVHEWEKPGAYNSLRDRMFKRRQPLMVCATNAGQSRASFCWQLRERAVATLEGKGDEALYPIIWKADDDAKTDDPAAWRAANPLLGVTVKEEKVRQNCDEAKRDPDPAAEAKFRRLYLGIWPKVGAGRWLDLAKWDAAVIDALPAADLTEGKVYPGVDLSQCDDLSAVVYVWATPARFYVESHFYLPRATAEMYIEKNSIPYDEWEKAGHVTLLDEPTISVAARQGIAKSIIERMKGKKLGAVCYDRYRADETVAALEGASLTCVPVAQGYSVSPGCFELDRRLKEGTIAIVDNPVLRFCAENAEAKTDDRGNIWIAKPSAAGRYAGTRWKKVDGLSALVTALTEARKVSFPAANKKWNGSICLA